MHAGKPRRGKDHRQVGDVRAGRIKKFWIICQKYRVDGFLVNESGNFHAYVNRCRHMPTPLDFIRDQFVSDDGRYSDVLYPWRSL